MAGGPVRRMRPYTDLFFLGSAFLLLETRSITGFALLFGTTWIVNALVFAGVLVVVLAAVEVTRRWRTPALPVLYGALAGTLLLAGLLPPELLLEPAGGAARARGRGGRVRPDLRGQPDLREALRRPPPTRRPRSRRTCSGRWSAAAWSTCRSIVGYQALLLLAALLYGLALWTGRRYLGGTAAACPCRRPSSPDRHRSSPDRHRLPIRSGYPGRTWQGRSPMDSRNPVLNREFSAPQLATFHEPPPTAATAAGDVRRAHRHVDQHQDDPGRRRRPLRRPLRRAHRRRLRRVAAGRAGRVGGLGLRDHRVRARARGDVHPRGQAGAHPAVRRVRGAVPRRHQPLVRRLRRCREGHSDRHRHAGDHRDAGRVRGDARCCTAAGGCARRRGSRRS